MADDENSSREALQAGVDLADAAIRRQARQAEIRRKTRAKLAEPTSFAIRAIGPFSLGEGSRRHAGTLIAEGDSWFDYPFNDVLSMLEDEHGFEVESVAHRGDTLESMAFAPSQSDMLYRLIHRARSRRTFPRAILLSGGGNDIAGEEFSYLLNHASSPHSGLNARIADGLIHERLRDALVVLIAATTRVCEDLLGRPVPILVHGYDYAIPDGRGFLSGFGKLPGPWLGPGFEAKGFPESKTMDRRREIVRLLIDEHNLMLASLRDVEDFGHVTHIDLRGVLSAHADYWNWWSNELHPTKKGFRAVAVRFNESIDRAAPVD